MQELINVALILIWPLFCCFIFTRLDTVTATFVSIVGGMLFLPVKVQLDLPLIPGIDKYVSSSIGAIVGIVVVKKKSFNWFGSNGVVKNFIVAIVAISFFNFLFNTAPIFNGGVWKAGLSAHEAVSAAILTYLTLLPLIIGINVVKSEEDVIKLLKLLIVALLVYLPFVLYEIRFSPQLHKNVYGFSPHSFIQQIRNGGFRAVVFLGHGLLTANFYLGGFLALLILAKLKKYFISRTFHQVLIAFVFICLIFLKSATALAIALLGASLLFLFNARIQKHILKLIVACVIVYPLFVYSAVLPLDWLYENLQLIFSEERLRSLYFRFYNEQLMVEYLGNYFLIGYGGSGRSYFYGAIPDGTWLVWTMRYGFVFWALNVLLYSRALFSASNGHLNKNKLVLLSVLPTMILVDQIPNSSWSMPWVWLLTGAIIKLALIANPKSEKYNEK